MADRAQIAAGDRAGLTDTAIAGLIGGHRSVVGRERRRNSTKTRGYRPVGADVRAQKARRRPQVRAIDADPVLRARVMADLKVSRTPRQVAGRLRLEAGDPTVALMPASLPAAGATVSHEAIYRWIYALPKGELATSGIMLRSKRRARRPRRALGERTARIVGMTSIDARPADAADRRVPGHWEGDLIIGAAGKTAAATLVERTSRFTVILGLPEGKNADAVADVLIEAVTGMPQLVLGSLTWDWTVPA